VKHDLESLSDRERETLRLLGRGHDAKSIASHFDVSVHAVNERLRAARRKLGVSSSREAARLQLAREATSEGLDNLGPNKIGVPIAGQSEPNSSRARSRAYLWPVIGALMLAVFLSLFVLTGTQPAGNNGFGIAEPIYPLPSLFAVSDYPAEAAKQGAQGITDFRLHVTAAGNVEKCDIERSSGSAALDQVTCQVIMKRARFRPAVNDAGNPVDSVYPGMIHWLLEPEPART
jgi:TonB family protein